VLVPKAVPGATAWIVTPPGGTYTQAEIVTAVLVGRPVAVKSTPGGPPRPSSPVYVARRLYVPECERVRSRASVGGKVLDGESVPVQPVVLSSKAGLVQWFVRRLLIEKVRIRVPPKAGPQSFIFFSSLTRPGVKTSTPSLS
jgi:hypothetical protein